MNVDEKMDQDTTKLIAESSEESYAIIINTNIIKESKGTKTNYSSFYQIEDDILRLCVKFAENDEKNSTDYGNTTKSLFVLDYSGSMSSDWVQVQNAVKYFIENGADSNTNNTYFIVYNHEAKLANISEILSMNADGMTSFQSAFNKIKEFISNETKINELINIIFMTDGHDNKTNDIQKEINLLKTFISESNREITIHSIGFNSNHDRKFLSTLNEIGNFGNGIYRYAEKKNDNLVTKFEEMFDFLSVTRGIVIKLSDKTSFKINSINKNEIDYMTKISKIDISDQILLQLLNKKQVLSINNNELNEIKCKYIKCDEFFYLKKAEHMEILTEKDLENAQGCLDSIKVNKMRKELRSTLLIQRMIVQSKLDKYYELFASISRGLISGDNILSELNSLRHETTFSRARQKRTMNKRASKNIKQLNKIQQQLNNLRKPDLTKFSDFDMELKCLLSGDSMMDLMTDSNNNIFVFTLNVTRPEYTLDAPTNIFVNKYLVGTYSMEAIQNATRFAIKEKGSGNALGGFINSRKFKLNIHQEENKENDDDDDDIKQGLFRGMDGEYSNSYLPLFINEEHYKRVEIQIKPILGYFFTLDPLGFNEDQFIALFTILGHMACCQANNYNNKLYKSEWFKWLINDFRSLCQAILPKIKNYLLNENGFGGVIKSGDLLNEFMLSCKYRSKQIIQNLLVIIGLFHCNNKRKKFEFEFEIKFIEELWRRNFSDYFKSAPRTQIEEILEKLIFDDNAEKKNENINDEDNKENNINASCLFLNKNEEKQYEKYAKIKLGIIQNEINIDIGDINNRFDEIKSEYKAYKLINYDENKEKLDKIIHMTLNKISKKNEFVSGYFENKPFLGKGIDGKLRWLMVIQALRFSSNSLMNSAITNNEYICAFDCLCQENNKMSIKDCLKSYIEYKEKYRKENYNALITNQKYLNIAKNIIMTQNMFSFCGKILSLCPTRGGKIFDNLCCLLFDSKINNKLIPFYDEKLTIVMNGKHENKYKIISAGIPWIHCPLNNVIRFKSVIGDKKWKIIEKSMHGMWGHRYRESDIPNRHGHCNSNPNPNLVEYFGGFAV